MVSTLTVQTRASRSCTTSAWSSNRYRGAKAQADVAHYTTEVARPGSTPTELRAARRSLIAATSRRDNLELSSETSTGPLAYLTDVDADQVDAQIATLDAVTAHKNTLP